jgi:hypothetical protein
MSKRTLSMKQSVRSYPAGNRMIEDLESRQMMSVSPATLVNGTTNDTVFDANTKTLHVIYYDASAKTLNYQSFDDNGSSSQVQTIDNTEGAGQFLSLAEDSDGILHAAYYDAHNGDLKYARRDLGGVWSTSTIDSNHTVGLYPSIAINALTGKPNISYYNKSAGDLRLAQLGDNGWATSMVANAGDVGRYSSLAFDGAKMGIGFENTTTGHFMYTERVYSTGAFAGEYSSLYSEVDSTTKSGGGYISLNFNNGLPAMSYYDAFNADLKYAERSSRGKWNASTVAAKNSQGLYTDLAFTFDTNQPAIVYYNKTSDSVILAYRKPGGVWYFETQLTGGGRNVTPADGVDDGSDAPALYLVWFDTGTSQLRLDSF